MALFLAPLDCVKAADPPNGPAAAPFLTRTTHTLSTPPTVPSHVIPSGMRTSRGKSVLVARERPWMPRPGTSRVTSAFWKASGSVPPEVPSTAASRGPAPSWLIWMC